MPLPILPAAALLAGNAGGLGNLLFGVSTAFVSKIITESGLAVDNGVLMEIAPGFSGIGVSAVQTTAANRPTLDDDYNPGRFTIVCTGDNYLNLTDFTGSVVEAILAFDSGAIGDGERVLLTQDTSNGATTKAAWEIFLTEELE